MTKRSINLIVILSTLIIIILEMYFFIIPLYSEIPNNMNALKDQENIYNKEKEQIENIKTNENHYRNIIKTSDKIYQLVPKEKEIDGFITKIEDLVKNNGNTIKEIKIVTPTETKTLKKEESSNTNKTSALTQVTKSGEFYVMPFQITLISNNIDSLSNCIVLLEGMNRFISIINLDTKVTSDNKLETTLDGIIYIKPDQ